MQRESLFHSGKRHYNSVAILRIVVGILILIHGITRIRLGIVDDFGVFLSGVGFPAGLVLAWFITAVEIAGSIVMASGQVPRLVRVLAIYFAFELTMGIILVHWSSGWFVVGAGNNGMEYSVLLIAVLLVIAYSTPWAERNN